MDTWKEWEANNLILFPDNDELLPSKKTYIAEDRLDVLRAYFKIQTRKDTTYIKELFNTKMTVFSNPKPVELLKSFISICQDNEFIVLDFFAGSSSTSQAVMEINSNNFNKKIKFILVQIPEEIDVKKASSNKEKKIAQEAINFCHSVNVPTTIAEISKERIRRAGQKIVQELEKNQKDTALLDVGFRVLKIDSSNMADIYYTPQQLQQGDMFNQVEHIKADRGEEDLLFQVLLDWGVDLTLPIEKRVINGKNVFFVDQSVLVACFDKEIDEELIKAITQYQPLRAVFRDDGFINDTTKINAEQLFKQLAPHSELRVI